MILKPETVDEVQEIVLAHDAVLPRGGGSKPALSDPLRQVTTLQMGGLSGIIEYQPGEYTFTAYAGTAVSEVAAALAENGQYLPFDPLLAAAGATLGGTVAANTSGSGRYRYGGVRDFLLGIRFVDGRGRLVRGGGKVVKNSAGFDLPKFFVGSLGRYGVLVELTFKVFPQPRAYTTLTADYAHLGAAQQATFALAVKPFEMDALDLVPQQNGRCALHIRLGGLPQALPERAARLRDFLQRETAVAQTNTLTGDADAALWQDVNRCAWAGAGLSLVKIPIPPKLLPTLDAQIAHEARRYTAGGNVAWVAVADTAALRQTLAAMDLAGLQLNGRSDTPILGARKGLSLAQRVKQALDPHGVFLSETKSSEKHPQISQITKTIDKNR